MAAVSANADYQFVIMPRNIEVEESIDQSVLLVKACSNVREDAVHEKVEYCAEEGREWQLVCTKDGEDDWRHGDERLYLYLHKAMIKGKVKKEMMNLSGVQSVMSCFYHPELFLMKAEVQHSLKCPIEACNRKIKWQCGHNWPNSSQCKIDLCEYHAKTMYFGVANIKPVQLNGRSSEHHENFNEDELLDEEEQMFLESHNNVPEDDDPVVRLFEGGLGLPGEFLQECSGFRRRMLSQ